MMWSIKPLAASGFERVVRGGVDDGEVGSVRKVPGRVLRRTMIEEDKARDE